MACDECKKRVSSLWRVFGVLVLGVAAGYAGNELSYVDWKPAMVPVDEVAVTLRYDAMGDGHFGAKRSRGRKHRGIDIAAPFGSSVFAVKSGMVLEAGEHGSLGKYVEILHKGQTTTLYAHLSDVHVKAGERVRQGDEIGKIGKTGNADHPDILPHVHFEYMVYGDRVYPSLLGFKILDPEKTNTDAV